MTDSHAEPAIRLAHLITDTPAAAACSSCLDGLEAYVDRQLAQADYATHIPQIAAHLDCCVECAEAYAMLYVARMSEQHGYAVESLTLPTPDLSFLLPDTSAPHTPQQVKAALRAQRLQNALSQALHRFTTGIRVRLSQTLLDLLPATPVLAVRSAATAPPLFTLAMDAPSDRISHLVLTAYSTGAQHCDLRVQLGLHEREWPDLADVAVALVFDDQHHHATTDAWGEVVFTNVPQTAVAYAELTIDETAVARDDGAQPKKE